MIAGRTKTRMMAGLAVLAFAGYALAVARAGWADPCPSDTTTTLQAYIDLGSTGCTIGDKLFSDFMFSASSSGTSATSPGASNIAVTPDPSNPLGPGFMLTGTWSVAADSMGNGSEIIDQLSYDVAATGGAQITDISGAMIGATATDPTGLNPRDTHDTYNVAFSGSGRFLSMVLSADPKGPNNATDHSTLSSPTPGMSVASNWQLSTMFDPNASATLSGVSINFSETPSAVPEPQTFVLMVPGLLGLTWLLRRRRLGP